MNHTTSTPRPLIGSPRPQKRAGSGGAVVRLASPGRSDDEIVKAVVAGEPWAAAALLDRYGAMVERLVRRVMGHDQELADLVHDAFATILASIHQVRDGDAVKGWIAQIAVHTAHHAIRRRRARRWLCFWKSDTEPPVEPTTEPAVGPRDALRRVYQVLEHLPADERVAFVLRFLEDMTVNEVAEACDVSLATIKRRLARAERRFVAAAQHDAVLRVWLMEGDRWTTP